MRKFLISLFLIASFLGKSQKDEVDDFVTPLDTIDSKNYSLLAIPLLFYTPETEFGFGAGAQLFFKDKDLAENAKLSNVFGTLIFTSRKQFIAQLKTRTFLNQDKYILDGNFKFQIYPNVFWGIGNDTKEEDAEDYNQRVFEFDASFLKQIPGNVNFGFLFSLADYNITEVQDSGLLASGTIEGSDGALLIGMGVILNVDSRDNYFSPLFGGFYQFKANLTSKAMGSTHSYNTFHLDFRKYVNLGKKRVLAFQLYTRLNFGIAPLQGQSIYGGAEVARGYFRGRYIDDLMYVAQAEYRHPVGRRWELAGFALTGNVSAFQENLFGVSKASFGFGPRYFIKKDNRSVLRLDIAFDVEGGSGIYFGVNEAF